MGKVIRLENGGHRAVVEEKPEVRKAGGVYYTEWGGHPGSSERWVDLRDDLSASLLQARLVERALPIKVVVGQL